MDKTQLTEYIRTLGPDLEIAEGKQFIEVSIPPSKLHPVALRLRNDQGADFDFLFCLSGVDYKKELGVVYHLRSTKSGHSIVLKVKTPDRENPSIDTVSDIWSTAELHEREVYDLLGIRFNNHPDLRRLFLDDSWGYPLRKDYIDDVNIVTK